MTEEVAIGISLLDENIGGNEFIDFHTLARGK